MSKLGRLEQFLCELDAATDGNFALWLSGGKDSLLLMHTLLGQGIRFGALRFDAGWTREQKAVVNDLIARYPLQVYSYPPVSATLFGSGRSTDPISVVTSYLVGKRGERFGVLQDIVPGPEDSPVRCSLELELAPNGASSRMTAPAVFKTHLLGSKSRDSHYALAGLPPVPGKSWKIGRVRFAAPLFDWTDDEVLEALDDLGHAYEAPKETIDTGNIPACSNCLKTRGDIYCPKLGATIPGVDWDPAKNLAEWRRSTFHQLEVGMGKQSADNLFRYGRADV